MTHTDDTSRIRILLSTLFVARILNFRSLFILIPNSALELDPRVLIFTPLAILLLLLVTLNINPPLS